MNRNRLHQAFTEIVAANLHQHEYPIPSDIPFDEVQGHVDGWIYRYRNEAVFKARVDTTVVGLMCALDDEME